MGLSDPDCPDCDGSGYIETSAGAIACGCHWLYVPMVEDQQVIEFIDLLQHVQEGTA